MPTMDEYGTSDRGSCYIARMNAKLFALTPEQATIVGKLID